MGDIYVEPARNDNDEELIMPMPNWLHDALIGPAAGCSPLLIYSNQHLSWRITADLYRYHQAHFDIISAEAHIESLKAQVQCCKGVQAGARGRMEMAHMEKKLSFFHTMGTAFERSTSCLYARRTGHSAHIVQKERD